MAEEKTSVPKSHKRPVLRYFDEILLVEHCAINKRRTAIKERRGELERRDIGPPQPLPGEPTESAGETVSPETFEYPNKSLGDRHDVRLGGTDPPDRQRTRPRPYPCDLTGLALSGGGIRSAAFCLGVLQALGTRNAIERLDYLSTVSGGGYIGAAMTVAMSATGAFPFQTRGDPRDTAAVGHIRNYSNYLLPRATSGTRNISEAAVILLRGIAANAVLVAATILIFAILTIYAYPSGDVLWQGSFIPRLIDRMWPCFNANEWVGPGPFRLTVWGLSALITLLLLWVLERSGYFWYARWLGHDSRATGGIGSDAQSPVLKATTALFIAAIVVAILDLQPVLLAGLRKFYEIAGGFDARPKSYTGVLASLTAFFSAIAAFSGKLGQFLKASQHALDWPTLALRIATRLVIWLAALLLPLSLLVVYLHLAVWGMAPMEGVPRLIDASTRLYWWAFAVAVAIGFWFKPNSYSLHQLYRDRLSKAFLFDPRDPENCPLDDFKLSRINIEQTPYHVFNAALNVQGSLAANQRGREADFFTFTRDFIGSDLTLYASTDEQTYVDSLDMEKADPALDVATAMAISGAAFSANMGSSTIRPLSPTLALLNVRLGYWMRNPRDLAKPLGAIRSLADAAHLVVGKFYLLLEMLNMLDEKSRNVYLSDGGHIENLGVYQLLKRGCQLVIAVDAECDPTLSFGSLIKMERFARIDLGIRIDLPWEEITTASKQYERSLGAGILSCPLNNGPHCVVGRILYHDGSEGILFYVKSSVTGDETDYVLDYKRRYPQFPHETTGDQFFSEEQFEAYRALGFHIIDHAFEESDQVALAETLKARGITSPMMIAWIKQMLCCV